MHGLNRMKKQCPCPGTVQCCNDLLSDNAGLPDTAHDQFSGGSAYQLDHLGKSAVHPVNETKHTLRLNPQHFFGLLYYHYGCITLTNDVTVLSVLICQSANYSFENQAFFFRFLFFGALQYPAITQPGYMRKKNQA
jgi:hypothetical protein